jgi:hypothetical protein
MTGEPALVDDEISDRWTAALITASRTPLVVLPSFVVQTLRESESQILATITDERVAWELRSDIQQTVFMESYRRLAPLTQCRDAFAALCNLGFRHLSHKSRFHTIYARYCVECEQFEEARLILGALKAELQTEVIRDAKADWCTADIAIIDKLLAEIAAESTR